MTAPVKLVGSAARLDLHEGVSHPAPSKGCARWPKTLRLRSSAGQLTPGRCRATNLCDYCARIAAVEVSEMLALDAMKGNAPRVWCVLTTREPERDPSRFYKARELVMRAVRRRWPDAEYVCVCEFTTGYGDASGGKRRPHWNVLIKNVPVEDLAELEAVVQAVWCSHVDAEPWAQFVGEVSEVGGLMRYLALHFLKESQMPPKGWRGHRVTASRGYFGAKGPRGSKSARTRCREEAQEALRLKRELWRAERDGLEAAEALLVAEARRLQAESVRWECVVISVDKTTGEVGVARTLRGQEDKVMRLDRTAEREYDAAIGALAHDRLVDGALAALRQWQDEAGAEVLRPPPTQPTGALDPDPGQLTIGAG